MKYLQAIVTLGKEVRVYMTYCRMCGEHADEAIIGDVYKYTDDEGTVYGYDHAGGWLSQYLLDIGVGYEATLVPDTERLPTNEYCQRCQDRIDAEQIEFMEEIERGGVRWMCEVCHQAGIVVRDDSQGFSKAVREQMQVFAPEHVTVKFNSCRQHACEGDHDMSQANWIH